MYTHSTRTNTLTTHNPPPPYLLDIAAGVSERSGKSMVLSFDTMVSSVTGSGLKDRDREKADVSIVGDACLAGPIAGVSRAERLRESDFFARGSKAPSLGEEGDVVPCIASGCEAGSRGSIDGVTKSSANTMGYCSAIRLLSSRFTASSLFQRSTRA